MTQLALDHKINSAAAAWREKPYEGASPVRKRLGPEKYELGPYPTPKVVTLGVYDFT